jgi:hypothetical protein
MSNYKEMSITSKEKVKKFWKHFFPEEPAPREIEVIYYPESQSVQVSGLFGENRNYDDSWSNLTELKGFHSLEELKKYMEKKIYGKTQKERKIQTLEGGTLFAKTFTLEDFTLEKKMKWREL